MEPKTFANNNGTSSAPMSPNRAPLKTSRQSHAAFHKCDLSSPDVLGSVLALSELALPKQLTIAPHAPHTSARARPSGACERLWREAPVVWGRLRSARSPRRRSDRRPERPRSHFPCRRSQRSGYELRHGDASEASGACRATVWARASLRLRVAGHQRERQECIARAVRHQLSGAARDQVRSDGVRHPHRAQHD